MLFLAVLSAGRLVQEAAPQPGVAPALRPVAATAVWRPTLDDVERISYGRPAKKKGTGSRGVPHRLNAAEREDFNRAVRRGVLDVAGSGYRAERAGAPLVNTYRNWCDARGVPMIVRHKGVEDTVVVDLSPLRAGFADAELRCLTLGGPGAEVASCEEDARFETE